LRKLVRYKVNISNGVLFLVRENKEEEEEEQNAEEEIMEENEEEEIIEEGWEREREREREEEKEENEEKEEDRYAPIENGNNILLYFLIYLSQSIRSIFK